MNFNNHHWLVYITTVVELTPSGSLYPTALQLVCRNGGYCQWESQVTPSHKLMFWRSTHYRLVSVILTLVAVRRQRGFAAVVLLDD